MLGRGVDVAEAASNHAGVAQAVTAGGQVRETHRLGRDVRGPRGGLPQRQEIDEVEVVAGIETGLRGAEDVEDERARCLHRRVMLPQLVLEPFLFGEHGRVSHALLRRGERHDLVERAAADAEREAGVPDRGEPEYPDVVHRPAALGLVVHHVEGEAGVDDLFGHDVVEAAGAHEPHHVPVPREVDVVARDEEDADRGAVRRDHARRAVHQLERPTADPVRMRAAAAEAVAAADPVTHIIDRDRRSARRELSRVDREAVGTHRRHRVVACVRRRERRRRRVREQRPSGRRVRPADDLVDGQRRRDVGFEAAETPRDLQREQTCFAERGDDRIGHRDERFAVGGFALDQRREIVCDLHHVRHRRGSVYGTRRWRTTGSISPAASRSSPVAGPASAPRPPACSQNTVSSR